VSDEDEEEEVDEDEAEDEEFFSKHNAMGSGSLGVSGIKQLCKHNN